MKKVMLKKNKTTGKIRLSRSNRMLSILAYVVMGLLAAMAILPCLHIIAKSISRGQEVTAGNVVFWPRSPQLETMWYILTKTSFLNALKNSLIVTGVGTLVSMITTITTAYPLSKADFKGRKVITLLYVISMVFFGGMIPAYMVVRSLGLIDTYAACILPFAIVQFNMFIVKNYFESLPEGVEESARIDGAGDLTTLVRIVCPMSKPVLATVSLLYAINYWNNYFHAMMYTKSSDMQTLQVYLYNIINNSQDFAENLASGSGFMANITAEGMVAAAVTMSIIPIVLLYPFVARYMVQGITIGSVKG